MKRFDPRKLLLSKWTAAHPRHREKHFLVSQLFRDATGTLQDIELQAVLTRRCQRLSWQSLRNDNDWQMGWH